MHIVSISLNKKLLQKLLKYKFITCHSIEKALFKLGILERKIFQSKIKKQFKLLCKNSGTNKSLNKFKKEENRIKTVI